MVTSTHEAGHRWTVDDLQELPDDGRRYELVDGGLRVSPSPAWRHNAIASRLARQLDAHCPSQLAVVAPGGGVLVPRGYLIPDLAVVEAALADSASHAADPSQVLLVVEVASPSSGVDDVREKTDLYAEAGIASYWRVELEPSPRIVVQELRDGRYVEVAAGTTVTVERPFGVTVSVSVSVSRPAKADRG